MGRKGHVILNLSTVLGKGTSSISIITSASFVLVSLFYAYTVGSYLKLTVYPFENRIIYYEIFHSYIFSQFIDHLIIISMTAVWFGLSLRGKSRFFLPVIYFGILTVLIAALGVHLLLEIAAIISMPIIVLLLIFNKLVYQKKMQILNNDTNLLLTNYFAVAGIVLGIIGLFISLAPLFSISHYLMHIRNYEYDVFLLLSSFSATSLLLLLSYVPVKIFVNEFRAAILRITHINNARSTVANNSNSNSNGLINSKCKFIYISLFMLLSLVIGLIPHQPQINLDNRQIGVDTDYYVKWTNALTHAADYREFIHQAFVVQSFGDRPLTLIFLFTIAKILNVANFYSIVEHVPLILGPLLVLAVFLFTRELTSNEKQALLASFLTSISFQVTVGIYAGFYANWFALIIGYLSFVFLLRSLKYSSNKLNLAIFSLLLIALLFTHVHTWSVIVVVMSVFLITMIKAKHYYKKRIVLLFIILSSSVVLDIVKTSITGSMTGIEKDMEFAKATGTGLEQFIIRWSNLTRSVYSFLGGQFSNFIIFSLGLYWLFQSNTRDISTVFLMIFLSIGLIAFLIGDYRVQARIFYDIPFQIPAAIALSWLRKSVTTSLISIPICIWLIGLVIRSVSNFPSPHFS
ncbi:MAG: hypothetical protein ACJ705_03765 [Nitrososphaeraceae archaeon]